jgi:hypothetical protein
MCVERGGLCVCVCVCVGGVVSASVRVCVCVCVLCVGSEQVATALLHRLTSK